ncbi:MAG: NAD(P)(+) transhydrogenase (Re/Si-specific) subunit alpha, partial [Armatimonadota bacterium]|nr:NAD(P)(+) transhydrogenase (Re/Si-specific) subunit alpha [Armatimonadota bacterium]
MRIGVTQETFSGEARVALVPAAIAALRKAKAEVLVQAGAGKAAGFSDLEYADAGATVLPSREEVIRSAEMVLQVRALGANPDGWREDLSLAREGQVWIALMDPLWAPEPVAEAAEKGILAFALELVPRITRAQPMDVLSSQS